MNDHPVRIRVDDDLRRSRLTVFFRLLLAIPHIVWFLLWAAVVSVVVIVNWFFTLIMGRPVGALQRFTAAFIRYQVHLYSFLFLMANPFPGFTGAPGTYPIELTTPGPERQHRLKTLFRIILVLPAWLVLYAINNAIVIVGFLGWWVALATGGMPRGLRDLGVYTLRYQSQAAAYLLLVTDRYPTASPLLEAEPPAAPMMEPYEPSPAPA